MNVSDNFEEYDNPELYDFENDTFLLDLPLIREFAKQVEGPVVELACGTGRIAIRLAEEGIETVGVDFHKKMLTKAIESEGKGTRIKLGIARLYQVRFRSTKLIYLHGRKFFSTLFNE
ncbi:class I SAM-dependent methyltransferase [Alkalihalobacterium alkalinitrilicum]|uniref:class I SAM-dependent methyltransferase n=1 Tax=Alkalihalobacterium alkalinitrilicum TaxID=427920 RepID=UPI00308405BE